MTDADGPTSSGPTAWEAATVPAPEAPGAPVETPQSVGGYRIERRLGGGGMGDVYEAFDERLHRRVALKAIRAEFRLRTGARERFLREARVLSRLDHPRICAIHDYLESPDGDFLVLELIEGEELGDALPRLTTRQKLDIAGQIADVLNAAHAAGIVHRDLKPSNVMLTPTGGIKVLDFGLARQQSVAPDPTDGIGPSAASASRAEDEAPAIRSILLTQPGRAVVGTPAYMSPEQAVGDPVGPASDMYSFGLLLQELFTGRDPYEDGLSMQELLDHARAGRTRPVTGLDRDLTTLIERLKSARPLSRPTAPETAAALRRIRGKGRRRVRWSAAAAVIVIAALGGLKYTLDLRRERAQAIAAREDADDLIVFMLGELHDGLSGVGRLDILGSVSDKALDYLSSLPEADLDDENLHRRAEALRQIGNVRMAAGSMAAAEEAFLESLALATDVVGRHPEHPQWLADLGASHFYIGYIRMERRDLPGALEQFDIYREIADRLVELDGPKPQWRLEQAYAHNNRGAVLEKMGDLAAAAREIESSIEIKRTLVEAEPGNTDQVRSLANGLSWLASTRLASGDHDGADAARTEELEIRRQLVERDPRHTGDRLLLSRCHVMRGELRERQRRCEEALLDFQETKGIVAELVEHDPENMEWKRDLAVAHRLAADAQRCLGREEAALSDLRIALGLMEEPVGREPGHMEWRLQLATIRQRLLSTAVRQERWEDALAEGQVALEVLAPLTQRRTLTPEIRYRITDVYVGRGAALAGLGRTADARAEWESALAAIEPLAGDLELVEAQKRHAIVLLRLDRIEEAEPVIRRVSRTTAWTPGLASLASEKGIEIGGNE